MATTAKGTPYVESSDLVSAFPTSSLALATHIDANLAYNAATVNAQTGTTYTFVLADATLGKLVTSSNAAATSYTVPPESSVAWPTGSVIRILNIGAGAVTMVAGAGVTINNVAATVTQWTSAALVKTGTNTWVLTVGGGIPKAVFSSATGAPSTVTSGGTTAYIFKGSGTITFATSGIVEILVVGGGAAGGNSAYGGGGGGGGVLAVTAAYVPAGTALTVTVGAGGTKLDTGPGGQGTFSQIGSYYAVGGGGGGSTPTSKPPSLGGSGGGAGADGGSSTNGAAGVGGQGSAGGNGVTSAAGGGGGGSAAGANGVTTAGGAGGTGATSTILSAGDASAQSVGQVSGGLVYYGGGGGGVGSASNGAAGLGGGGGLAVLTGSPNTGGGGRGGTGTSVVTGGTGVVIVKVG